jgi:hypothetical protein
MLVKGEFQEQLRACKTVGLANRQVIVADGLESSEAIIVLI